jgi:hypothetical protein
VTIAVPVQQSWPAATPLRVTATFVNKLTGLNADPAAVYAGYQIDDQTPVKASPSWPTGGSPIVHESTGVFHWDIDTTGFAPVKEDVLLTLLWDGVGGVTVMSDPETVEITGPPFALP